MADFLVKGIKRINEFADPELLEINELTQLDNAVLDKEGGKAIRRGGFGIFNNNATSNTINSLHDIVTSEGTNLLLGSTSTLLIKSTSGTGAWSNLKTGLTTGLKTRLAAYDGIFTITNGTDTIFTTDGTSTWNLEISAPSVANITSSAAAGGSLGIGEYKYILVYVSDKGEYSVPSQPFTHYLSTSSNNSTSSSYNQLRFDNIPVASDTRVVRKLIFRTKIDSGIFYLLRSMDNDETYFEDDVADTSLDTSESVTFINIPTKGDYLLIHRERLFISSVTLNDVNYEAPAHSKVAGSPPSGWTNGVATAGVGDVP